MLDGVPDVVPTLNRHRGNVRCFPGTYLRDMRSLHSDVCEVLYGCIVEINIHVNFKENLITSTDMGALNRTQV